MLPRPLACFVAPGQRFNSSHFPTADSLVYRMPHRRVPPSHSEYQTDVSLRWLAYVAVLLTAVVPLGVAGSEAPPIDEPPVAIRIVWGGGKPRAWSGSIRLIHGPDEVPDTAPDTASRAASGPDAGPAIGPVIHIDGGQPTGGIDWRMLSTEPDAGAMVHASDGVIMIHQSRACGLDGVEVAVGQWEHARLVVQLVPDGQQSAAIGLDVAVADLLSAPTQRSIDGEGNRVTLKRAAGDELRVTLEAESRGGIVSGDSASLARLARRGATVRRPGETVRVLVHPLLPSRSSDKVAVELRVRVKASPGGGDVHAQTILLHEADAVRPEAVGVSRPPQEFSPVTLDVPLPQREGVYDIQMEAVERGGLRWSRPIVSRTVQVVAVADVPLEEPSPAQWRVLYELDPGSPRLLERLRRMPGMGMPSVSLPTMPMPTIAMPKLLHVPMPHVQMPKLPSVGAMVPRMNGLLSIGHSSLESHPLGPVLRLPPAASADEPTWEGMVVAVTPGMPHVVEIDYPPDQDAMLGISVLEQEGAAVRETYSGGFEVLRPPVPVAQAGDGSGVARAAAASRHSFVFWPHTKMPLLLLSNASPRHSALIARVRILAGPSYLASNRHSIPAGASRRAYAFIHSPDFSAFGAVPRVESGEARPLADWNTFLIGIRHSAEWIAAQGAAGAMVGVYGDGAAIWPSDLTHRAPRWDSGGSFEGTLDPVPKDVLEILCRVYARQKLAIVPAITCNGPLASLEAILSKPSPAAAGILCVGRDGRPCRTERGAAVPRYNILDPRVQAAAEDLVRELAGRLRSSSAVSGIAIVLPHDGWMHLPGVAWGLDDATFGRFIAASGPRACAAVEAAESQLDKATSEPQRCAQRAMLVEGPLREAWLEWRAEVVAAFYARLADVLAEHNPEWNLHVVPTTLLAAGDVSVRFRPTLAAEAADADVLREIGLDPGKITSHGRIIFVSPHVHAATHDLVERSTVDNSNRSLSILRSVARATRRGVVVVEQPANLHVRQVLPHGPFGAAGLAAPVQVFAARTGDARRRSMAESMVASDVEVVFDASLLFRRVDDDDGLSQRAFESLPTEGLDRLDSVTAPLVMRSHTGESGTWICLLNACGVPCRALVSWNGQPSGVVDAASGTSLPVDPTGGTAVDLRAWEARTLVVEGDRRATAARASFDPGVEEHLKQQLAGLRRRRAVLEMPVPLAALDNPSFELPELAGAVTGWEILEPTRGSLALADGSTTGGAQGAIFSSINGLSTLRSNPFPAPDTGRISVALWLRIAANEPQPPLRIAVEGIQNDVEYYRFAVVGRGVGTMPLGPEWSQFVLQVDDLPTQGIESLRVRMDLLGPGHVHVDDVRIFDLAFDESQRVQLTKRLGLVEQRLSSNEIGACLVDLDSHWPHFLNAFISDATAEVASSTPQTHADEGTSTAAANTPASAEVKAPAASPAERAGFVDRLRRWWQ